MTNIDHSVGIPRRVGAILREAREARKLTIREVSAEINTTTKYVEALENEDYSQFPGETYTLGFLRNYATHLGLDTERIVNLYRGIQIDQSKTPLRELTRPTPSWDNYLSGRVVFSLVILAAIVGAAWFFLQSDFSFGSLIPDRSDRGELACAGRTEQSLTLPAIGAPPLVENLSSSASFRFNLQDSAIRLCIESVERDGGRSRGNFALRLNESSSHRFSAVEGETILITPNEPGLAALPGELRIMPRVIGDHSSRLQIETLAGDLDEATERAIEVTLEFVEDSFFQWSDDGRFRPDMTIRAGEVRQLSADTRLEIRVGNGGGVRIIREGMADRVAGPPGRVVRIIYRKVPDPLDPTRERVVESIDVMQ